MCLAEAAVITAAFLVAQRGWSKERARLLDRIMARDYAEYRSYTQTPVAPKRLSEAERNAIAESARLADAAHGIV